MLGVNGGQESGLVVVERKVEGGRGEGEMVRNGMKAAEAVL